MRGTCSVTILVIIVIVSRIAYDILEKDSPRVLKQANDILKAMAGDSQTQNEGDHIFVESSVYADFIKYRGGSW